MGQGGKGTERVVACRSVTVLPSFGRNGKDLACQMLGFSFCATQFDLTYLRTKLCVVSLSTGEHGYWHSGF